MRKIHNNKICSVDLSNTVQAMGILDFDKTLTQILKGLVDMGQYPEDIPPYDELARTVAAHLETNGFLPLMCSEKASYQLMIQKPRVNELAIFRNADGPAVIVPQSCWWILGGSKQ